MKQKSPFLAVSRFLWGTALFMLLSSSVAESKIHVILFGGTVGQSYSPSSVAVSVGDTIEWRGNFSFHPLSSATIPAGATAWHNGSGTVFSYPVLIPGTYNYICDAHAPTMVGSFTAAVAGVNDEAAVEQPTIFGLQQNYPNPFNPSTQIAFSIPGSGLVTLKVFDLLGREVTTLVNGQMDAGLHFVEWDAKNMASGRYLYKLDAGGFTQTRGMMLLR